MEVINISQLSWLSHHIMYDVSIYCCLNWLNTWMSTIYIMGFYVFFSIDGLINIYKSFWWVLNISVAIFLSRSANLFPSGVRNMQDVQKRKVHIEHVAHVVPSGYLT